MKKTPMAILLAATLLASGCARNIAIKKDSDRVYLNTNLKSVAISAVQAINASNMAVGSTNTPVNGMVVISAKGTANLLLQIEAPSLTLTLTEVDPTHIRVEATALLPGQSADFGLTENMVNDVFKSMDATLNAAGQAPHTN